MALGFEFPDGLGKGLGESGASLGKGFEAVVEKELVSEVQGLSEVEGMEWGFGVGEGLDVAKD